MLSTFMVSNLADSGPGSLRQAIVDANAAPGNDLIAFNTPLPDLAIFRPLTPLPAATDPVVLDATTEPGFQGRPIVILDGSLAGPNANGLVLLGGQSTVRGMVITGFSGYGIMISGGGGDSVQGNYIGVDVSGGKSQPNRGGGILILGALNNTIGSQAAGGGNVISGNGGDGLRIVGPTPGLTASPAAGNQVLANVIGLDSTGTNRVGNALDGVHLIRAASNAIGGTGFDFGNVISGNAANGIEIEGDPSYAAASGGSNRVQGNMIGSDRQANPGLGNAGDGIRVAASANTIGGQVAGAGNLVANNGGDGVNVQAQRVPILSNSIFGNSALGINLADSANNAQKAPAILSLTRSGPAATVAGTLNGSASTAYTLQFFGNLAGETQARTFLGSAVTTTGSSGFASFAFGIPGAVPHGGTVTATATDAVGNTSALSSTIAADAPRVLDVVLSANRDQITVDFSTAMDPSTAADTRNYIISTSKTLAIRQATLAPGGRSVVITLRKAIPIGTFARVAIDTSSAPGLTSAQGVRLDGNGNGQPGGTFQGKVAVGAKLHYTDAAGHVVTLQLAKKGVLEAYRSSSGNAETVRLYGSIAGRSILSGTVKGRQAQTPITALIGLNGAINRLMNPPFVVAKIV